MNAGQQPLLEIDRLKVHYGSFQSKWILKDLSFTLQKKEIVTLLGPSGCGKTTILNCIAGFIEKINGKIKINGRTVQSENVFISPHQRQLGVVFQDHALFPHLSVYDNIVFALSAKGQKRNKERIDFLINQFKIGELLKRYPHEISGGQQQRVALARSIAPKPPLLLMDEPFASQDVELKEQVMDTVVEILKQDEISALIVTHDHNEAFSISDKMGIMKNQKLEQYDFPHVVYHHPETKFVADFIGHGSFINGIYHRKSIDCGFKIYEKFFCLDKKDKNKPCESCLQEGEKVLIFLRPDEIEITQEGSCDGEIVSKKFRGSNYLYGIKPKIAEQEDILLQSSMPSLFEKKIGESIRFKVKKDEVGFFRKIREK